MRIRIEKIDQVKAGLPANDRSLHVDGQLQNENFSLPLEYTIEGELIEGIKVGQSVRVLRDTRNGVKAVGLFETSRVSEVLDTQFKTQNSVYNFKFL